MKKLNGLLSILILIWLTPHVLFGSQIDLTISQVKFIIESEGDIDEAISLLHKALLEKRNENEASQLYYYLLICYIKTNNQTALENTYIRLKQYTTSWSNKGHKRYIEYRDTLKGTNSTILPTLDEASVKRIVDLGGSLAEYTTVSKENVSIKIYIELLERKLDINKILQETKEHTITIEEYLFLLDKNISLKHFSYLTGPDNDHFMSRQKFFSYAENPVDIIYLVELYRLGLNEIKFLVLKKNNIDIGFFIEALKRGYTEENFYQFKNEQAKNTDPFYKTFSDAGYRDKDFHIARMFGQENFDQFKTYIRTRRNITVTLATTLSLAVISSSLIGAGLGVGIYELQQTTLFSAKINEFYRVDVKNAQDKRLQIWNELVILEQELVTLSIAKTVILISAASTGLLTVLPAVFLGISSYRRYKMLNIFSHMNIEIGNDHMQFTLCFNF